MKTHHYENPTKYEIYKLIRRLEKNYFPESILRALEEMAEEYKGEIRK